MAPDESNTISGLREHLSMISLCIQMMKQQGYREGFRCSRALSASLQDCCSDDGVKLILARSDVDLLQDVEVEYNVC